MSEHRLEVADVFRTYEKEFFAKWGQVLGPHQRKAYEAIRDCRTAALGGHVEYVEQCDTCGHRSHLVQLVPQPALPKMPGHGAR